MPGEVAPFPACHWTVGWGLGCTDRPVPHHEAVPTVTPHLEGQQRPSPWAQPGPTPCPQAVLLCASSKHFSREEREEMEGGCCIPSFLDPPWDVFLHPWLFAAASKPSREAMPNPTEQPRLERGPDSHCLWPHLLPGSGPRVTPPPPPPRCHWVLLAVPRG